MNDTDLKHVPVEKLLAEAREAQNSAYAPYSQFMVGAAVLTTDGTIYRGCNVENASYGLTMCAERVALFSAVANGCSKIIALALVTSAASLARPCGACRQVMAEFSRDSAPLLVVSSCAGGETVTETLNDLLPHQFELTVLRPPQAPLL